jgi:hypothetical protein
MVFRMEIIGVVRKQDMAKTWVFSTFRALTIFSGATLKPGSITWNPEPFNKGESQKRITQYRKAS